MDLTASLFRAHAHACLLWCGAILSRGAMGIFRVQTEVMHIRGVGKNMPEARIAVHAGRPG